MFDRFFPRGAGYWIWSFIFGAIGPTLAAWFLVLRFADRAQAIPVFARKYHTSCITCHTVYPKLNDVGEAYRRNGYQFPSDEDVLVKEEPVKLGIDACQLILRGGANV